MPGSCTNRLWVSSTMDSLYDLVVLVADASGLRILWQNLVIVVVGVICCRTLFSSRPKVEGLRLRDEFGVLRNG